MFERFTDRARKVMALANQEAQKFNHEYLGTEHILLGLVKEGSGVGANVLRNLNVDLAKVRTEVEKLVKRGPDLVTVGRLPQTPLVKHVIEHAIEESRNLNHRYVGTEHLLLGLIRVHEGVAARVLINLGLLLEDVREEVLNILGARVDVDERIGDLSSQSFAIKGRPFSMLTEALLLAATAEAVAMSAHEVTPEHVLLAMFRDERATVPKVLAKLGVTREAVVAALRDVT